jgi:hypothetical protein
VYTIGDTGIPAGVSGGRPERLEDHIGTLGSGAGKNAGPTSQPLGERTFSHKPLSRNGLERKTAECYQSAANENIHMSLLSKWLRRFISGRNVRKCPDLSA